MDSEQSREPGTDAEPVAAAAPGRRDLPGPGVLAAIGWTIVFLLAASIVVTTAVTEEVFARGFIGRGSLARRGLVGGIAVTSLLFGALHAEPAQFVTTALIAIVFHAASLWSRSLLASMVMHALHNGLVLFVALCHRGSRQ